METINKPAHMKIEQIYTGCLAQGAYYIESNGEAAIIDPLREVQPYIDMAKDFGAKIKYIFETHFHADFVSGHVTLSEKTGAPIVYGPTANPSFDAIIAKDGQTFKIGDSTIIALHTPGHTMESTTYLMRDSNGKDVAIFSGDTLFLGDVGRPDLAQKAADMTKEDLAGILYDSLRSKIMPLSDDVIVYPAHGAGSACGKNMMKETVDTLGNQKKVNYALRADMTKEEFITEVTDGLQPPPAYFPMNVRLNKEGYDSIDEVLTKGGLALSPEAFERTANQSGALVLDVRKKESFVEAHVPSSIFIGLEGSFAPWVGELIKDVQHPILLVVEEEKLEEAITRLSRIGFDNTLGYLEGGMEAWKAAGKETDSIESISATTLEQLAKEQPSLAIVDIRKPAEYASAHISSVPNYPLSQINKHIPEMTNQKSYIHCAGGYRSLIAASILKSRGIHDVVNVEGGFGAIKKTGMKLEESACSNS